MTTEQKLNNSYYIIRQTIKEKLWRGLSYHERQILQMELDNLDALNTAYQVQIAEFRAKESPDLPEIETPKPPDWMN